MALELEVVKYSSKDILDPISKQRALNFLYIFIFLQEMFSYLKSFVSYNFLFFQTSIKYFSDIKKTAKKIFTTTDTVY